MKNRKKKLIALITIEVEEDDQEFLFRIIYQDEDNPTGRASGVLTKNFLKHEPLSGLAWDMLEKNLNDSLKEMFVKLKELVYKKIEKEDKWKK